MTDRPTLAEFRAGLRAWLTEHLDRTALSTLTEDQRQKNSRALYDAGYLNTTWPVEYGGRGYSADYQTVYNEELASYPGATLVASVTVGICAATLLDFGTEEQKKRHLPRMLRGDEQWTQLLSEPGAGSDLAGVTTRARRDGEAYRLDGQKVWTSAAIGADFALAFVRTDPELPKHKGVSMLIVDLTTPGVDIRPLREMTGEAAFNEVFFDDALVPADNLVGEFNGGWAVLSGMLTHERIALSAGTTGARMDRDTFAEFAELARDRGVDGDPEVRAALVDLYVQQRLLDDVGRRMREATQAGLAMGPVGSLGKIGIARSARASAEAGVLIGGPSTLAWREDDRGAAERARSLLYFPMTGIAGGTTEIQKNIVAERLLGLPREPQVDRDIPFSETSRNA
ncbi:acyl-CoA dehydrogenase family protein [Pseudonocardia sp. RS010]|uniref:acyl-CoA dehydrogenase family protein n=1 Tax=Pseudonocardia sp. RS010 TaxID=3385979 RepID=UPI0039A36728